MVTVNVPADELHALTRHILERGGVVEARKQTRIKELDTLAQACMNVPGITISLTEEEWSLVYDSVRQAWIRTEALRRAAG